MNSPRAWYSSMYSVIGELPSDSGAFQCKVMLSLVTSRTSGVPGVPGGSIDTMRKKCLELQFGKKIPFVVCIKCFILTNKY